MEFHIGQTFEGVYPPEAASWCIHHGAYIDPRPEGGYIIREDVPPPLTEADYDRAMEEHLQAERSARGYTTREPSEYVGSSVARWAQDAADWIAHRDAVMLYAIDVMNHYRETGEAPTLEEFRAALPRIQWTINTNE